jgi:hypothetical protein
MPSAAESSQWLCRGRTFDDRQITPGGPAEWLADGHVTCNIQCSGAKPQQFSGLFF